MNESNQYRVLIVDDDPMVRNLISTILSVKGHTCDEASDGFEALEKLEANQYDAVVLDIVMPNMDGMTLMKKISQKNKDLPVMMMTGYSQMTYRKLPINEAAIHAGASEFIDKPFDVNEFYIRFYKMMLNHKVLSQMRARQQEIEALSSKIITELQKESLEKMEALEKESLKKIEALRKECEDLKGKLEGRHREESEVVSQERRIEREKNLRGEVFLRRLEETLGRIKTNR
jgi:CheY-like chemotaxis protein